MPTKDPQLNVIGKHIASLRKNKHLTQEQLAKRAKTTQSVIARVERGQQNVSSTTLARLSGALGTNIIQTTSGTFSIQVEGGHKLKGVVATRTSKNATVALLCASLLNKNTTTLNNVPRIEEVSRLLEVLKSMGVQIKWEKNNVTLTPPKKISLKTLDKEAAIKTRSIILFLGPLVHHLKSFSIPQPGGCKLGARTVKPHFYALENLGVKIETKKDTYRVTRNTLKPKYVVLYESGDTVTENLLMAAALTPGKTTIRFASANYQVQDLCHFLGELGVKIEGIGTTTLVVHGVKDINTPVVHEISEDPIESMFFLAAAAVTKSSITIKRCPIDFLELELLKLKKMGFKFSMSKRYKARNGKTDLVDITTQPSRLVALEEKIEARPYPGLNIDNLPFFAVIATQAHGQTLIHDWVYEKRAIHYKDLDKLGADTILADPHRFYVTGQTPLKAAEIICPPALRPAAILLIGMLAAEGVSTLRNIYNINRGYEDLVTRLSKLGAKLSILNI